MGSTRRQFAEWAVCSVGLWAALGALGSGCDRLGGGATDDSANKKKSKRSGDDDDDDGDDDDDDDDDRPKKASKKSKKGKKSKKSKRDDDDDDDDDDDGEEAKPKPPAFDPFTDASTLQKRFEDKLGGKIRALELLLYPPGGGLGSGRAILQAEDPAKKHKIDEYLLQGDAVQDPVPVKFNNNPSPATIDANLFPLADMDLSTLPKLGQDAKQRVGYADASVSHAILHRALPFTNQVQLRVFVRGGSGESGFVDYDVKGQMLKVNP